MQDVLILELVGLNDVARRKQSSPYDTPPWRRAHRATSSDDKVTAEIADAREHSMSNPTIGTLKITNGHEIARCSPAFIWSDDSRYLAVPQWIRCFGLFLRQRLLIVDVRDDRILASRFTYWLMDPKRFVNDQLELAVSSATGISWMKPERVVLDIPNNLKTFVVLSTSHGTRSTNNPMHGSGEVGRS